MKKIPPSSTPTLENSSFSAEDIKQLDEQLSILVLVAGTLKNGKDHYAYASIPPSKYYAFKQAETNGNYNLADFGKILMHGEGKEPPSDVKKRMIQEHGANHYFEEELSASISQLYSKNKK